jgi:hypothetical protein
MPEPAACVECGAGLPAERAELGYRYCTAAACQAVHHPGLVITTVGVNKSADSVVLAEEAGRRAGSGGLGDGDVPAVPDRRRGPAGGRRRAPRQAPVPVRSPRRGAWTPQQEKVVRLYHDMGLSPRGIADRARLHTPRLGITERLAVDILSARPGR